MTWRPTTATRISLALMCLTLSVLLSAHALGLVPDPDKASLEGRTKLAEAVAVQCSIAAQENDLASVQTALRAVVTRCGSVRSAAVRSEKGTLLAVAGDHTSHWDGSSDVDPQTHMKVPIRRGDVLWGEFEMCFEPLHAGGVRGVLARNDVRLVLFVALAGFAAFWLFLRRTLRRLDPSTVIPSRVRSTLDTLAEGVFLLDREGRIVLANAAFSKLTGKSPAWLLGRTAEQLPWRDPKSGSPPVAPPWRRAIGGAEIVTGVPLTLGDSRSGGKQMFVVNAGPIRCSDGQLRGAMVTFDDMTEVEQKNARLEHLLAMLRESQAEIQRQNRQLQFLAMRDPLTDCLNRRAFFERLETEWTAASRYGHSLGCIMIDVDHFKRINDHYGHVKGDQTLQSLVQILRRVGRKSDIVCRYGGEEFCILLPHTDLDKATQAAERAREAIARESCHGVRITVSLGVSSIEAGALSAHELLDQTDKALYVAKSGGRNRTVRWDEMPKAARRRSGVPGDGAGEIVDSRKGTDVPIPMHAVNALASALSHRDFLTGEHARHVADLCAAVARGLMSASDVFVLEVAAQLHDVGKLGVPDSILLKPGPLSEEEWKVMRTHEHMGVEIIESAFACPELTEIVRNHHATYTGSDTAPGLPAGTDIPLGARILSIADAYSAMVSDRPYRQARSPEEAFRELRRCAGEQFDPELVERFIRLVRSGDEEKLRSGGVVIGPAVNHEIGRVIERMGDALAENDLTGLASTAERLAAVTAKYKRARVEAIAEKIASAANAQDVNTIVSLMTDLMTQYHSQSERPQDKASCQRDVTGEHSPKNAAIGGM
ncbi:MAG: diguanylate cyclase [Phycisphaerae bacterium]|nr:diguanylate cyclase [Phycisphaerae bacterium]